jgi:hypothetical protein
MVLRHHATAANAWRENRKRVISRHLAALRELLPGQSLLILMLAPPTEKFLEQRRLVG